MTRPQASLVFPPSGIVAAPRLSRRQHFFCKGHFMKFLETLPPDPEIKRCSDVECKAYEGALPEALLRLWREVGRGSFAGGLLFRVDPAAWEENLADWLLGNTEGRYAIARSAFGDIFYYRDLGTHMVDGRAMKVEDVSRIDPHRPEADVEVCAWSLDAFFERYLCDAKVQAEALRKSLFEAAVKRLGRPTGNDGFYFAPALALGGRNAPEYVEKGDILEHLAFLVGLHAEP
jgi:hypothetical protein